MGGHGGRGSSADALSVETLRAIVANASDGIFVTDENLRIEWVNDSACALLGCSAESMVGKKIAELLVEEEGAPLLADDLRAGKSTITLRRFRMADGASRALEVSAKSIGQGKLLGLARDATQRLRSREQLERSEASFRTLIETTPDAIIVHRDGKVIYANAAAATLLRAESAEQLHGMPALALVAEEDRPVVIERLRLLATGTKVLPFTDERIVRLDGTVFTASVGAMRVVFEGEPSTVVIARDITSQRRLHEQLAKADRMTSLGTLAAGVAHEINNPLTYVLLHLDALVAMTSAARRGDTGPSFGDRVADHAASASEGAQRVARIVRDLRAFSRFEDDVRAAIDVHRAIELAISTASHELKHRAKVVRDFSQLPHVLASEGRVAQIVLNLLLNAAHAIPEGHPEDNEVSITTAFVDDEVRITVRDTGVGIPEEHRRRLFEPFFTTKPVGEGSGLGLAICHGLVTTLGGTIRLLTELGKGTAFTVALPPAPHVEDVAEAKKKASERPPFRARVLVVDDEPAIGDAVMRALGARHEVRFVSSALEARALLETDDGFDVLVCDVVMPVMSGADLHRWITEHRPHLAGRILFTSGGRIGEAARALATIEPWRWIDKPFRIELLEDRIAEVVRRSTA